MAKLLMSIVVSYDPDPAKYPGCDSLPEMAEADRAAFERVLSQLFGRPAGVQVEVLHEGRPPKSFHDSWDRYNADRLAERNARVAAAEAAFPVSDYESTRVLRMVRQGEPAASPADATWCQCGHRWMRHEHGTGQCMGDADPCACEHFIAITVAQGR